MAKMIKPIVYLKPNQCPSCFSKMELVEEEVYVGEVDSVGRVVDGQSYYDIQLRCPRCRKSYPASKKGMHYYITPRVQEPAKVVVMEEYNPFYN